MSQTTKEVERSFDGSPMPTKALPKLNRSQVALRSSMKKMTPGNAPFMGLIYGEPGTQKTTLAMRLLQRIVPQEKMILFIDTAAGWTVLNNEPALMERTLRMSFENIESLELLCESIAAGVAPFDRIGGIILDEYTSMHDRDLNWVVRSRAKQKEADGGFKDPFMPALPDYNAARIRSNTLIEKLLGLEDMNIVFIGHSKVDKAMNTVPDMPEKAGKALYSKVHFVYYTSFNTDKKNPALNGRIEIQTTGGNRIMAKNRINGVPSRLTLPVADDKVVENYKTWGLTKDANAVVPEPIPTEQSLEDIAKLLD